MWLEFPLQGGGGDLGSCTGQREKIGVSRRKRGGVWCSHIRVEEEIGVLCQAEGADRASLREEIGVP